MVETRDVSSLGQKMCLRYPHARLSMLTRLSKSQEGCFGAFSDCANQYGLPVDINQNTGVTCASSCEALQSARAIAHSVLTRCGFEQGSDGLQKKLDEVTANIESCLRNCNNLVRDEPHQSSEQPNATMSCRFVAPLVMDCLLQQLEPYIH